MGLQPISFLFIAAGIGRRARLALTKLKPSQVNLQTPSWEGHGSTLQTGDVSVPITDRSYWEGRYVLTEITIRKEDGDTMMINDATVTVSLEKHIVRTALVGLNGTIKEYISNGDYDISLTVGIVAVDASGNIVDEYPEEGIRRVREFLDENRALEVSSPFFDILGIDRMVVSKFSLRQDTHSNRQTIEVKALSDVDYEIKHTEY